MKLSRVLFFTCMGLSCFAIADARAQTTAATETPPVSAETVRTLMSPAYQLYNDTMVKCFSDVKKVNPFDKESRSRPGALALDKNDILAIQACMNAHGVEVDFTSYYSNDAQNGSDMNKAQKAEIEALGKKMEGDPSLGKPPVPQVSAPAPVEAAAPVSVPLPVVPSRATVPQPAEEMPAEEVKPSTPRERGGKYWNSGQ